jgi:hypothetical protein
MHPILVAALAEERHRRCLCGAVTQQSYRLRGGCRHGQHLDVHDHATSPSRRYPLHARHILNAPLFARVVSLLQDASKGTES